MYLLVSNVWQRVRLSYFGFFYGPVKLYGMRVTGLVKADTLPSWSISVLLFPARAEASASGEASGGERTQKRQVTEKPSGKFLLERPHFGFLFFRVETRSGTVTGKSLPVTGKRLRHGVRWSLTLASFARYFSLLFFVPLPPSAASLCLGMRGMIGDGFSGYKFVNFVNFLEKCKPKSPSPTIFPIRQGVFKVFLRFLTSFEEFPRAP